MPVCRARRALGCQTLGAVYKGEGTVRPFHDFRLLVALGLSSAFLALASFPAAATSATLPGVDVSHYNGTPDWSAVKQAGIRFVVAKATEGTTFTDPHYASNKTQAQAVGPTTSWASPS